MTRADPERGWQGDLDVGNRRWKRCQTNCHAQ